MLPRASRQVLGSARAGRGSLFRSVTSLYSKTKPPMSLPTPMALVSTRPGQDRQSSVGMVGREIPKLDPAPPPPELDTKQPGPREYLSLYASLGKARLGALVALSALGGYAMADVPMDLITCGGTMLGTTLCIASANSLNQWLEGPFDSQMSRTQNRPLPRGRMSSLHALGFGAGTAVAGSAILLATANPLTMMLGAGNILLYAGVYTPLKRFHPINTDAGAVVGAIPPIMGYAAATGGIGAPGLLLGAYLYCWQMPHFLALSWNLRGEYAKSGYQMLSVTNPVLTPKLSFAFAGALSVLPVVSTYIGMTDPWFLLDSAILNGYFTYTGYRFYCATSAATARKQFLTSLWYLPVLFGLMIYHKKKGDDWDAHEAVPE